MDANKRKREDDGEMHGKRTKAEEVDGGKTVMEDEVEEFFAILRRIRVAVKYFEKDRRERRKLTGERWRPRFEADDFDEDNKVINNDNDSTNENGGEREEAGEEIPPLDLNSDPAP